MNDENNVDLTKGFCTLAHLPPQTLSSILSDCDFRILGLALIPVDQTEREKFLSVLDGAVRKKVTDVIDDIGNASPADCSAAQYEIMGKYFEQRRTPHNIMESNFFKIAIYSSLGILLILTALLLCKRFGFF